MIKKFYLTIDNERTKTKISKMDSDKKQRMSVRKAVTVSINSAKACLQDSDNISEYEAKLKGLASLMRAKLCILEELDAKIIATCDYEDIDKESSDTNTYQTNTYVCLAEIEEALEKLRVTDPSYSRPLRANSESDRYSRPDSPLRSNSPEPFGNNFLRLPKISIEPFDGDPRKYQTFMDSFESSINSNSRLNDVDKFLYLKGLLKGKAFNTIEGLSLTAGNYDEAMTLLRNRFGDKKSLVATFFDTLLNLSAVTDADTTKLRDLYDCIESCVRNLKSLGITSEGFGPVLIPTILTKIPQSIRLEVTKATREQDWDFDGVLKCLHSELTAREQCKYVTSSTSELPPPPPQTRNRRTHRTDDFTGSSLHASIRDKKVQICVYCKENHKPWQCQNVTDISKRKEILKSTNRCFNKM